MQARKIESSKPDLWHKKIAQNRGAAWKRNMLAGRRDAILNPSNIRLLRIRKDIHQAVIARKLDMSESTFGAIERGKRLVKKDMAEQIANHLSSDVKKLFKPQGKKKFVAIIQKTAV